jgi:ribonuclease HII
MIWRENMARKREIYSVPIKPTLEYEQQLWGEGFHIVAGLDEAGRGAWAGPVFAAAVVLPRDERILRLLDGVRDSKRMTANQRNQYLDCIKSVSVGWTIGMATNNEIDELGIVPATCLAMQRAIDGLAFHPTYLLVDYIQIENCACPQLSLTKGDCRSLSIAAASVIAKTARDAFMVKEGERFPAYNFTQHKGYGTSQHRVAIEKNGPCAIHRMSFRPLISYLEANL